MSKATSPMTVGVTGPRGFIAGNVMRQLSLDARVRVVSCGRDEFANPAALTDFVSQCDTIVHLAGMNRGNEREIYDTNTSLVDRLVDMRQHIGLEAGKDFFLQHASGGQTSFWKARLT